MTKQVVEIKTKKKQGFTIGELYEEKKAVYEIVRHWRAKAAFCNKKTVVENCDRVIAFLDMLCK